MYTIIGNGRVARHFSYYLSHLGIPFRSWSRKKDLNLEFSLEMLELSDALAEATHVLVLISDSAIEQFVLDHVDVQTKTVVHFSGSLSSPLVCSAHPLMTFTEQLYPVDVYRDIPFVIEKDRGPFEQLLPGLPNPHYVLEPHLKPLYHALCVMSGNFTAILWDKVFLEMESKLGIPAEAVFPYLTQVCTNIADRSVPALTGPLVRRDYRTLQDNMKALADDPFLDVYQGFLKALGIGDEEEQQ